MNSPKFYSPKCIGRRFAKVFSAKFRAIRYIKSEQWLSNKFLKTVIEGAWMMKSGKLFQKSIILTEKKLTLAWLSDSMCLKKFARVASSLSYMRCSEIISKIDPQVIVIHTVK